MKKDYLEPEIQIHNFTLCNGDIMTTSETDLNNGGEDWNLFP